MNGIELTTDLNNNIFSMLNLNWLQPKEKAAAPIVRVAGIAYYQLKNIYHHLTPGVKLTLRREQHNKHDKMAVAVYYRNFKVGYLPCVQNTEIAKNLDNGRAFEVEVFTSVKDKYLPTEELYIAIEASK
jgi:hypothetical protein